MKTQGNFNRDKMSSREGENTVHTGGEKGGEIGQISLKGDNRRIVTTRKEKRELSEPARASWSNATRGKEKWKKILGATYNYLQYGTDGVTEY